MQLHTYILCLGSNFKRELHLSAARTALTGSFPSILFGEEMTTEAIGEGMLSPFSNQLAQLSTPANIEEVRNILKNIEHKNGRLPEDKGHGIIKLDIDILIYDGQTIKPNDLKRDFIQHGLKELEKKCADVF